MITFKWLHRKSASPPTFKKTCPWTILPPPKIFQCPPFPWEAIKIYSPFKKGGGGVRTMYLHLKEILFIFNTLKRPRFFRVGFKYSCLFKFICNTLVNKDMFTIKYKNIWTLIEIFAQLKALEWRQWFF